LREGYCNISEVNFCKVGAHSSFSLPNNQDARKNLGKKSGNIIESKTKVNLLVAML